MRILLVIDDFGSGGAQRQLVYLATGLQRRGHRVEILVYNPANRFFRPAIDAAQIVVHEVFKKRGFSLKVLTAIIDRLRSDHYDAVVSFLDAPNIYAELARIASPRTTLIVSERSSRMRERSPAKSLARRLLHVLATRVVANSHDHAAWLGKFFWLRAKTRCIYNGYPVPPLPQDDPRPAGEFRLIAIGRVGPEKNAHLLVEALHLLHQQGKALPVVNWVGRREDGEGAGPYLQSLDRRLEELPHVQQKWNWLGERTDVPQLLASHHALVHPSLYEGLPNVVCEALLSARPVLASHVCDHPLLVKEGVRGFLFDPRDPVQLADAMTRLAELPSEEWRQMSIDCRQYAIEHLSLDAMVSAYENELARCGATSASVTA